MMRKEELMDLPTSPYILDIHQYMKFRERRGIQIKSSRPEFSQERDELVRWMMVISDTFKLSKLTQHLGIYLIDRVLIYQRSIQQSILNTAAVCLRLAAKFEGDNDNFPKLERFIHILNLPSTKTDLINLEGEILKYFKFEISWPTAGHFGQIYSVISIVRSDKLPHDCTANFIKSAIRDKMAKYLDLAVKGSEMITFRQSQIAASCLFAARYNTQIRPVWPYRLTSITGYTSCSLNPCLKKLAELISQHTSMRKRKFSSSDSDSSSPDYIKSRRRYL